MTTADITKKIAVIVAEILRLDTDDIKPECNLATDLGADSLDQMEIIMAVEEEFGVTIGEEDAADIQTVNDVIDWLGTHLNNPTKSTPAPVQKPIPAEPNDSLHPATQQLVDTFAEALAAKLLKSQEKRGASWTNLGGEWPVEDCRKALFDHLLKGDPVDVAAFCAFLWSKGFSTKPDEPVVVVPYAIWREFSGLLGFIDRMSWNEASGSLESLTELARELEAKVKAFEGRGKEVAV